LFKQENRSTFRYHPVREFVLRRTLHRSVFTIVPACLYRGLCPPKLVQLSSPMKLWNATVHMRESAGRSYNINKISSRTF